VLFDDLGLTPSSRVKGLTGSLGDELLRVHRNYQPLLASLPARALKGAAHITGGGLIDNLPRVLPADCDAAIDTSAWKIPFLFRLIGERGGIDRSEMFQVFNMGIGMAAIVSSPQAPAAAKLLRGRIIGHIVRGSRKVSIG